MDPIRFFMVLEQKIRVASPAEKKQIAALVGAIVSYLRDSSEEASGGAG